MTRFLKRWAYAWTVGLLQLLVAIIWICTLGVYHPHWDLWLMMWISKKGWQY